MTLPIVIHDASGFDGMRKAGKLAASVLDYIEPFVKPGVTTEELNELCHAEILAAGAIPAPLNYKGFPRSICTSVNHVVCHGIPGPKKLQDGDIVNIDVTVKLDGWHGDTSRTYLVGNKVSVKAKRLVQVTYNAMMKGIAIVKPNVELNEIGLVIQSYVEKHGYSVVMEFCGHGIGKEFHAMPQVLHYYDPDFSVKLRPGMFFTIEPMVNAGKGDTKVLSDGWTAVTRDQSLSAQFEHTIAVTETGFEIFTLSEKAQTDFFDLED